MPAVSKLLFCIDDDDDDCSLIEEATAELDPRIIFMARHNGKAALEFLHQQKARNYFPCLIFLDINMPGMTGKEVLVEIKKDVVLKNIPVVVFTTSSSTVDQLFCEKYGVEMITKPNKASGFKKAVQQMVSAKC
jgi:CheY-like chemotaxis protein